ncbi:hypothetical protein [Streptomyces albidoflavus]|uniref:hypothetical protein n=1 Tax=Streptomyces albidoflavus TaxID=1886 RepID=UPI0033EB1219
MTKPTAYTPLFDPAQDPTPRVQPVDLALDVAREALANCATKNVHERAQMISAAASLHVTLHQLVIALDAERGEGR